MKDLLDLIKDEGDKKYWIHTTKNGLDFECSIRRVTRSGHLCGYVHLTRDNDYFGEHYDNIPVACHGGLTFADAFEDGWIIGFDCAHHGDYQPFYSDMEIYGNSGTYRDMIYVQKQCESICEQISTKSKSYYRNIKLNSIFI